MASRHDDFLAAGGRLYAIAVDSPSQNGAMIEKLALPFPILSDPDRAAAITPYGVAHPTDERNIAFPAIVVVDPDGAEAWRWESRDFADRIPEDDVIAAVADLGLEPTAQTRPQVVEPEPGPRALPLDALGPYLRGARFAAVALGMRHEHIRDDTAAYVAEMDRFLAAYKALKERRGS